MSRTSQCPTISAYCQHQRAARLPLKGKPTESEALIKCYFPSCCVCQHQAAESISKESHIRQRTFAHINSGAGTSISLPQTSVRNCSMPCCSYKHRTLEQLSEQTISIRIFITIRCSLVVQILLRPLYRRPAAQTFAHQTVCRGDPQSQYLPHPTLPRCHLFSHTRMFRYCWGCLSIAAPSNLFPE